ncbi:MAG TPA: 4Fe-4S binding protein [Rhizomicrobium sp.]|nr:4Fe-4S binding protein [Rhizomicrobium sp.]
MKISQDRCVACGNCATICPMGAIYVDPDTGRSTINRDECVECYACYNGLSAENLPPRIARLTRKFFSLFALRFDPEPDICPTSAFEPDELQWPRVVRRAFSDPCVPHESTGVIGRGTEEVKTNELTNWVSLGEVGLTIEFGRPGVGARFYEIQEMSRALAAAGIAFEKNNPIAALMPDMKTGELRKDILNEKILSAILEIKLPVSRVEDVIRIIWDVEKRIGTIVVLGVGVRCDENGEDKIVAPILERLGYNPVRAKTNLGLGRRILRDLRPEGTSSDAKLVKAGEMSRA